MHPYVLGIYFFFFFNTVTWLIRIWLLVTCTVSQWVWHISAYFLMITTLLVVYNMAKMMGDQGLNICPPPPSTFHSFTSGTSALIVFLALGQPLLFACLCWVYPILRFKEVLSLAPLTKHGRSIMTSIFLGNCHLYSTVYFMHLVADVQVGLLTRKIN